MPSPSDLHHVADRCWNVRDYPQLAATLTEAQAAAAAAPDAEARAKMADMIRSFVTSERLNLMILDFIGGALDPRLAERFWDLVPDEGIWPILIDTWGRLPDGETRSMLQATLRRRLATNMDLLRQTLSSTDPARVRVALALLDERTERLFASDLTRLASHADETIRQKALAAIQRA